MFFSVTKDQTLALAGLFQAAQLVVDLSRKSDYDEQVLQQSALSILKLQAKNVDDIYGENDGVHLGLKTMLQCFGRQSESDHRYIYQYMFSMHALSMKLRKLPMMSDEIAERLQLLQKIYLPPKQDADDDYDDDFFTAIDEVYKHTLSKLLPRIIVQGDPNRIKNQQVANRIRAALFAGIRSGHLWHQLGGRRAQILFARKSYTRMANHLLTSTS